MKRYYAYLLGVLLMTSCNSEKRNEIIAAPEVEQALPKYSTNVPDYVTTPDLASTKLLGDLEFFDGVPKVETAEKVFNFLNVSRGVEAFLNWIPAASVYAGLEGFKEAGMKPGDLGIYEELMDARSLFLTANSTTMYTLTELNVKDGPMVIEVPPGVLGPIDDAFFRWVTDVGITGPDKGQGGSYLLVHKDYEGEIPEGYFVARTPTYRNILFFRAFIKDGDLSGTASAIKKAYKSYPLSQASNPPEQVFHNLSGKKFNTIHANTYKFYEEINAVIQYEPADAFNEELLGQLASIGIKKDQPFNPDPEMRAALEEAAIIGNASARALSFTPRKKSVYIFEDRQWIAPFAGMSYEFLNNGERVLDDRVSFHYMYTGITPAMAVPMVGSGSVYAFLVADKNKQYLDGGKTYKVTLPAPIPVNNFWSFMVYSNQHRSMLETDQKTAGVDSNSPDIKANEDGSYTVWFGPAPPEGMEGNWVQTMPGKGYNVLIRLYGPLQPWFDQTWRPGDLELVE